MKKLRITIEDRVYDVTVEVLEDDDATSARRPLLPSPGAAPMPLSQPAAAPPPPPLQPAAPPAQVAGPGSVVSPLSGTIIRIDAQEGQQVKAGDTLLCLEAMKMNTDINAPGPGTVQSISVAVGASVQEGQVLLTIA
tara:strand:- start:232 stop:642 length:411 start_codon:yes stop_codon:yes gene_type:complete